MNHFASYNKIGLHPEQCNNANNVKKYSETKHKIIDTSFLVRLVICTDGTYQMDLILYGSEAEKHECILFFKLK